MLVAFAVGALIGAVGIGGILLIPALATFGQIGIHEAMATALFTFLFTGLTGSALYERRRSIDWRLARPLCAGALVFAFAGAWFNSLATPLVLIVLLAALILFAGVHALVPWPGSRAPALASRPKAQQVLLTGIGATAGLGSGLTGVGGPALSVPLMLLGGFAPLASIGASQVIQVIAAASGTLAHLQFGAIDFSLALPVAVLEVAGVFAGVRFAHAVNQRILRRCVGVLCLVVGGALMAHAPGWI